MGKGRPACDQLVERGAERIQIAAPVHRLSPGLLRRHVAVRPDHVAVIGDLRVGHPLGETEVHQRGTPILADQDVSRLHVAVQKPSGVDER